MVRLLSGYVDAILKLKPGSCPHCGGQLNFHGRNGLGDSALFVCVECDRSTVNDDYSVDLDGIPRSVKEQNDDQ